MPNLDLDNYAQDMAALIPLVTDVGTTTSRKQRVSSKTIVEVTVTSNNLSVTMLIQESGLYIKGFRNDNGRWYFKGEDLGASQLKFTCSYVGSGSIGIFADSTNAETGRDRNRGNIDQAVRALSTFAGGNDLDLKIPLATMAFLLSESIRFSIVLDHMTRACDYSGTFSFADLQAYVQNWGDLSAGKAVTGTVAGNVYTSHS